VALHVKGHAAAHAAAYTALHLAAARLGDVRVAAICAVLLVPGNGHQHVHAVQHVMPDIVAGAGTIHGSRVVPDASMDMGGFGAAFYGSQAGSNSVSAEPGATTQLQHIHAQEIWLCLLPLAATFQVFAVEWFASVRGVEKYARCLKLSVDIAAMRDHGSMFGLAKLGLFCGRRRKNVPRL